MCSLSAATIANWISSIYTIVTASGVFYAIKTLKNLDKTLKINEEQLKINSSSMELSNKNKELSILMAVLTLDAEMNNRKSEVDKDSFNLQEYISKIKTNIEVDKNDHMLDILENKLKTSNENYLNSIDRLSFCILKNIIPDKEWKNEYKKMLNDTIINPANADNFKTGSKYRNIIDLDYKWQRE